MTRPALPPGAGPLSDAEFDCLSDFLDAVPDNEAMTIEEMDGFFCALIIGPDVVMPGEYLPVLLGGDPGDSGAFATLAEAQEILGLLMRYWNSIAMSFERLGVYEPLFDAEDSKGVVGRMWARGFMQGVDLRLEGWHELLTAENSGDLAMIGLVAGEIDPRWPKRKLSRKKMDEIALLMAAGAARARAHFLAQRQSQIPQPAQPARRAEAKTGRNEPCPCGSGKKFKKCCGGVAAEELH